MRERLISKKKQYLLTIVMMTLLVSGMIPGITKGMIVRAETTTSDITISGTDYTLFTGFTATAGTAGTFGYANFVDGNTSTNWLVEKKCGELANDFAGGTEDPAYVEFHADVPIIPKGYVLTCDDEDEGFWKPVEWALKAKLNEGDEWTTIHYSMTTLGQGKTFEIPCTNDQNNKYQYFRFEVYEVGATDMVSLDELQIYGKFTYTPVSAREATCTEYGLKNDGYQRSDGKYFSDETGTNELTVENGLIDKIAHNGVHHDASDSNIEYWQCSMCSKYFTDTACTQEVTADEVFKGIFGTLTTGTNGESGYYILESKTYTLTDDVNTAGYIYVPEGVTATIDLNGHTIDRGLTSKVDKGSVIIVDGTLTIKDSGTGGKVQGGYAADEGSCVRVQAGATFTLQSGTLIGRVQDYDYTVFIEDYSNFTMTGGKITEGMNGIFINGNVTISGGEISGNENRGVRVEVGEFSVYGKPFIKNNTRANVQLSSGYINVVGALNEGANIGIKPEIPTDNAPVTVTSGYGTYNSAAPDTYFTLDNNGQKQTGVDDYMTVVLGWNEDRTELAVGTAMRTVAFDMNGHGTDIDSVSLLSGYKVGEPTEPTADDWLFVGWFTDAACMSQWNFNNAVTSNMTLHALWTQNGIYSFTLPENMVIVSTDKEAVGGKYPTGTNIRFKVKSADYVVDGDVKNGEDVLTPDGDGIYTVTMGDADITITATIKKAVEPNKTLSGSDSYTAQNGDVLTGSTSGTVTIANNAKIALSDATITGGIVCEGSAEITLVGTNSVSGATDKAGIQIGTTGTTLTIKGDGSLTANGGDQSAGIGLSRAWDVDATGGDIVIEGGMITANGSVGGQWGAGIGTGVIFGNGSAKTAQIGNVTIKGGTVKATGGSDADGIGSGHTYYGCTNTIGTVKIYDGINMVDASSIKNSESIVYMHGEEDVTANASTYFTIAEDGNRRIIQKKDDTDYNITIDANITGGTVTTDKVTATAGELVTLTVTPESGYGLQSLTVKDASDNDVSLSNRKFIMPKGNVTVSATFVQTTAAFDEATGVLTLNGNVDADEVKAYGAVIGDSDVSYKYCPVTSVVCEPGTVLPADCSGLFLNFLNTSDNLTIDLSNADVSGVTNMSKMFGGDSLTTIYVNSAWSMEKVTSSNQMFYSCRRLIGGNGTMWMNIEDSNGYETAMSSTYAVIDGKKGQKGYLTVKPKQTPSAPTANVITYTGEAQELVTAGDGTMTYSLDGNTYSEEIPKGTDAGTYTVYYKVESSDNWNAVEAQSITVTIGKATPTVTTPTANMLTYNGEEQELVTKGSTDFGKVLYSLDGTNYYEDIPKAKNVGNYTVYYMVEGTDNWDKVEAQSITVTIDKATPTVTSPTAKTLTYTGSAQELVTAGAANFGKVLYRLDGTDYSEKIPNAINVGDYTVYYKVEGTDNWDAVEAKTVKVSIAPKPISPTIKLSYTSAEYDKTEKKPVVAVTDEEGIIKDGMYSISYSEDCVNSGEKSVTVTDIKGDNYEIATTEAKYNITPNEVSLKWENLSFTYDGTVKTPSVTAGGVISGDSCDVTVTGGQIKAGSYTATAESLSNSNYSLPADKTIAFRISKATTTPNTPEQTMEVDYSVKTAGDITLPDDWVLSESDKEKDLVVGTNTVTAVYTGDDKGNYETESVAIEVTRAECKHTGMVATEAKAQTCVDAGNTAYWYCPECGRYYSDSKGETEIAKDSWVLKALGHEYGEPIYTWSEDGKSCTAKTICTRKECTDDTEGHTVTETVQSTGKETKAATCEEKGITTYIATFENELFKTQTKEVADIDAKGHRYGITTYEWSEDGKSCTATSVCSNDSTHKITETTTYEPDKADSQIKATVKEAATTEKMGTTTYTATFKNAEMFKVQTKDVVDIPKVEVTDNPSDIPSDEPSDNPTDNPSDTPSDKPTDKPTDKPGDNPSKPTDTTNPTDTTKPSDTTKTDGNTSSNDNTKDTPVTPAPKEEGAKLPVTDTKAEYVVTSKAGEEPAVEYKPESDAADKTVSIPESVTVDGVTYAVNEIADNAFKGNKTVESVVIPKSVKEIGDSAFSGCTNLKSVTIPGSVTEIGDNAFTGCTNLKSVKIPESVTEIGDKAFSGCKKLKGVTIGMNVAEIGDSAFANCSALTKATLPANVTKLGSNIFKGCKKLKTITIKTKKLTAKNISKNAFKGIGKKVTIKVPKKMKKAYTKLFRKKGLSKKVKIK